MREYDNNSGHSHESTEEWVVVGETENRTLAEFAVNGLKSCDIPAVLDARPGFLGTAGLTMRSLSDGKVAAFRILVPAQSAEEASLMIKVFLGESGEGHVADSDNDEEGG